MSLRAFHIFFVTIASLFCLWFGLWSYDEFSVTHGRLSLVFAFSSAIGGVALLFYLNWFVRRTRQWTALLVPVLLAHCFSGNSALACAVCFGAKDSAMVQGANAGIGFLLAIICVVLVAFASLFIVWIRRAQKLGH
ncbi:MAG: hypothetical protein KDD51_16135 [Bdellovibrionales bacterium]|nr:hypothetical protein [Bdellovibrionales bacterium]MCB0417390.1 hypothetical protein [Bdellovibrionales bacterium]MCB9254678.1 hypothetical protein [Pseudobdellovibrionaceae bacterium]